MPKLTRLTRAVGVHDPQQFVDDRTISSDATDRIKVSIPAGAVNKRINLQHSNDVHYMAIASDVYPEGLTFKINSIFSREITLPSMALLTTEATLNGDPPRILYVSNGETPVTLNILLGRSRQSIPTTPAPTTTAAPTTTPGLPIPIRYDFYVGLEYSEGEKTAIKDAISDYIDSLSPGDDIPFSGLFNEEIRSIFLTSTGDIWSLILAGGDAYLSTDNAVNWEKRSTGLPVGDFITAMTQKGTDLYVGRVHYASVSPAGVYKSTDYGLTWNAVNNGIVPTPQALETLSMAATATAVFAGNSLGIFRTLDDGASWSNIFPGHAIRCFYVNGSSIYAGTDSGLIYISTNNGDSWTSISTGLPSSIIPAIVAKGTDLYAGNDGGGVYKSTNGGLSWTNVLPGFKKVWSLAVIGDHIFAGTIGQGLFVSSNDGSSWTNIIPFNEGIYTYNFCLLVKGTDLYVSGFGGVIRTSDYGVSWTYPENCVLAAVINSPAPFFIPSSLDSYKNNVLSGDPIPMSPGEVGALDKDGTAFYYVEPE